MADSAESAVQRGYPRWTAYIVVAVIAVLVVRAVIVPLFVWDMLRYPIDYFIGEGDQLFFVHRLMRGQTIYNNSTALPFMGNVYPPVYPWLAMLLGKFVKPTLASARLFAVVPLAGTIALTILYLKREKLSWPLITIAALLIPTCYSISHFLIIPRCDNWMTLFCLGSLYSLNAPNLGKRELLLGGCCSALALFTKQTALFALVPMHLILILRRPRTGLLAAGSAALFCSVLLVISLWQFGPMLLESLTSLTARRTFDATRLLTFYWPFALSVLPLLLLSFFRIIFNLTQRRRDPLDGFILGGTALTLLMVYQYSASNYFLPLFPALVISSVLAVNDGLQQSRTRNFSLLGGVAALGTLIYLQLPFESTLTAPKDGELVEAYVTAKFLTDTNEPVYTERCWGAVADRPYLDQYFVEPTHIQTLPVGRFDDKVLETPFREQRFARVVLYAGKGFHPPGFTDMVFTHYKLVYIANVKVCFGAASATSLLLLERK